MKINFKSKILVKGLLVLLAFSLFPSAVFAEETYLHIALKDTKHPATAEEVGIILDRCPKWLNELDGADTTPLHLACRDGKEDIAKLLIDRGASLDLKCRVEGKDIEKDGKTLYWTPLIFAARNGHDGIVRYLLAHGVNVNAYDSTTYLAPIHFAARYGHLDVLKALFADKTIKVDDTGTFLNDSRVSPLCLAARYAPLSISTFLVEHGATVNFKDSDGWTPLQYAVLAGDLPTVQFLVEHGANVNNVCTSHNDQGSPLHAAAYSGRLEIVRYLVEKGADVNLANKVGQTPLHVAVKQSKTEVAKFLVTKNSFVYRKDNNGETPFMLAEESGNYAFAQELLNCH